MLARSDVAAAKPPGGHCCSVLIRCFGPAFSLAAPLVATRRAAASHQIDIILKNSRNSKPDWRFGWAGTESMGAATAGPIPFAPGRADVQAFRSWWETAAAPARRPNGPGSECAAGARRGGSCLYVVLGGALRPSVWRFLGRLARHGALRHRVPLNHRAGHYSSAG